MAEGTPSPLSSESHRSDEAPRGERSSAPREGGFRIRLSDNEMRSARALQEAFGLRSTVAVLGFALRTLGQQLEEGKLEELVALHRSQSSARGGGSGTGGGGGAGGRSEGRRERSEGRGGRWQEGRGTGGGRGGRVDPFARPARPTPPESDAAAEPETDAQEPPASTPEALESPALESEHGDVSAPTPADGASPAESPSEAGEAPDAATPAPEASDA